MAGPALLVFGLVNLSLDNARLVSVASAWMGNFVSPAPFLPGLWLHLIRSRRRIDIQVSPPAPGQHQPPYQPSGPVRR